MNASPVVLLVVHNTAMDQVTVTLATEALTPHALVFVVVVSLTRVGVRVLFCLSFVTRPLSRWLGTGLLLSLLTHCRAICPFFLSLMMRVGGLENIWLMDSGCLRHMTGSRRWFSSLTPKSSKEYIAFGDNGKGKIVGVGAVVVSDHFSLREVALVDNLGFNLLSVFQLLEDGYDVIFKRGLSRVLDARGDLVCLIFPFGRVFRIDFSSSFPGPTCCLVAGSSSSELWKWHRHLGHLSFDLLNRLSSFAIVRGLPKLVLEKDLVCHPFRHGKMVAISHPSVNQVMTAHPGELLHMDIVGPARVRSVGGKLYILVIVDDFSRYSWVFFMETKDEAFEHVRDLILRLKNELSCPMRAIRSDNGGEFRNARFEAFCCDQGLDHQPVMNA